MVDLLLRSLPPLFREPHRGIEWQCRAAHILKDCGATGLFRAPTIAELKSVHKQTMTRARISSFYRAVHPRCRWQ